MEKKTMPAIEDLTDTLKNGVSAVFESNKYKEYLQVMSRFHRYSARNTLLIFMQNPSATNVAGYKTWQREFNRSVTPEQAHNWINILAPAPEKYVKTVVHRDKITNEPIIGADGNPETHQVEYTIPKFKTVRVYDISQTTGAPLPTLSDGLKDINVANYPYYCKSIETVAPYPITFEKLTDGSEGYTDYGSKRIVINLGLSEAQTISVMLHETAHARMHSTNFKLPEDKKKDRNTLEVEAESVAYVVAAYFGIETNSASFPYIATWSKTKGLEELQSSLDTIQREAKALINDVEKQLTQIREVTPQLGQDNFAGKIEESKMQSTISQKSENAKTQSSIFQKIEKAKAIIAQKIEKAKFRSEVGKPSDLEQPNRKSCR